MAMTYQALAQLLAYPTQDTQALCGDIARVVRGEGLVPSAISSRIAVLAQDLASADLYDAQ